MQVHEGGAWNWSAVVVNSEPGASKWACNADCEEEKQKLVDMGGLGSAHGRRRSLFRAGTRSFSQTCPT
jgi:hypothetical protein